MTVVRRCGILLAVILCAACSFKVDSKPSESETPPSPGATTTITATVTPRASPSSTILSDAQQEYMLRLEAIKPEISGDELKALSNGAKVCAEIAAGTAQTQLVGFTARTFAVYGDTPLTSDEATRVLAVVRSQLCPQ